MQWVAPLRAGGIDGDECSLSCEIGLSFYNLKTVPDSTRILTCGELSF